MLSDAGAVGAAVASPDGVGGAVVVGADSDGSAWPVVAGTTTAVVGGLAGSLVAVGAGHQAAVVRGEPAGASGGIEPHAPEPDGAADAPTEAGAPAPAQVRPIHQASGVPNATTAARSSMGALFTPENRYRARFGYAVRCGTVLARPVQFVAVGRTIAVMAGAA